jgi:hypothetical protein
LVSRLKTSPFEVTFDKLQEKWKCSKSNHRFCYREGETGIHYQLEAREWGLWATAINEKRALFDYPPRTLDFNAILEKQLKMRSKKKSHNADDSSSDEGRRGQQTIKVINVTAPVNRSGRRHSDPYSTPMKSTKSSISAAELLVKRGYNSAQFDDEALSDYCQWLYKKHSRATLSNSFDTLKTHGIGADLLGDIEPAFLMTNLNIPAGDALRITKYIKEWLTEAPKSHIEDNYSDLDLY